MRIVINHEDVSLRPLDDPQQLHYFEYMTQILLTGTEIEISFKCHYMLSKLKSIVEKRAGSPTNDSVQIADFAKEFTNVIAGKCKTALENCEVMLGQSLPFCIHGYNEIFYSQQVKNDVSGSWTLKTPLGELVCSTVIKARSEDIFKKLTATRYEDEYGKNVDNIELF